MFYEWKKWIIRFSPAFPFFWRCKDWSNWQTWNMNTIILMRPGQDRDWSQENLFSAPGNPGDYKRFDIEMLGLGLIRYFSSESVKFHSSGSRHSDPVSALVSISIDVSIHSINSPLLHSKVSRTVITDPSHKPFLAPSPHCQTAHGGFLRT